MNTEIHWKLVYLACATIVILTFLPAKPVTAEIETPSHPCSGEFKGKRLTLQQLQQVIESHKTRLGEQDPAPDPDDERVNFCGIDLSGAELAGVDLSGVDLVGADLSETDLSNANLSNASLRAVNLSGAVLRYANLSGALLRNTDLSDANLRGANLGKAKFSRTNLSNAYLRWTDLSQAIFETLPGTLPDGPQWVEAAGLSTLKFQNSPYALRELREIFKKAGQRKQEREITYAIKKGEAEKFSPLLNWLNFVFFDLSCQYAMSPLRPLSILVWGIFLFAVPYAVALMVKQGNGRGAIWRVWSSDRLIDTASVDKSYLRIRPGGIKERIRYTSPTNNAVSERERLSRFTLLNACRIGLYFSLLSAFHFGWRDLNVGNWISRMQPREYLLHSTGWVRTVSGVQSLLSVYLLALWALSYFGRPFG